MFFAGLAIGIVIFGAGVVVGRLYEAKIQAKLVASSLAAFAAVDHDARSLVVRVYGTLARGIRAELDKLLPR